LNQANSLQTLPSYYECQAASEKTTGEKVTKCVKTQQICHVQGYISGRDWGLSAILLPELYSSTPNHRRNNWTPVLYVLADVQGGPKK